MIAVDVRLYDSSSSSDFEEKKQTEVVIVLPSTDSCDKPKRYLVHLPVFVPAVTFVQAAFSVYYVGIMQNDIITIISSPLVFSPFRQTELWRFVTYMFVHDGLVDAFLFPKMMQLIRNFRMAHISLNTLFQLLIGVPLEGIHGWRKVVVVYFVGGAIGVLMGSNWHPFAYGMGSSGAIFVMVGCLLTTAVFHVALPSRGIRCGIAALCFMVIMFSVLQAEFLFTDQESTAKTHIAHGNSFIIGIPLAIIFLRVFKHYRAEQVIILITVIIFSCATVALAIRSFSYYFTVIADMEEPWILYCQQNDDGTPRNDSSMISPSCY